MLEDHIRERVAQKGICVMGHIVCGYPSFKANWEILDAMEAAGVDLVEIQFPFSDPIADGPLFLTANQESLKAGTRLQDCFEMVGKAAKIFSFKILMMGYYNTVFKNGEQAFCSRLSEQGGSGMIIPDLPLEESGSLSEACQNTSLSLIRLVAPTNTPERISAILKNAQGFVYAVARKGVTGVKTSFSKDMEDYFALLKKQSPVPLAVGFGLSSREDLFYLKGKADIAVIGTAILNSYLEKGIAGVNSFFSDILKK